MDVKISLIESLGGFKFNVNHLNGHEITIETKKDQIIKHKDVLKVSDLGMPIKGDSYRHGDLYVSFEVIYPKTFKPETLSKLKEILPKGLLPKTKETKNTYQLDEYTVKSKN